MKNYRVGITARILENKEYVEIRDAVSHDLISFIADLNLQPVIIPNNY